MEARRQRHGAVSLFSGAELAFDLARGAPGVTSAAGADAFTRECRRLRFTSRAILPVTLVALRVSAP